MARAPSIPCRSIAEKLSCNGPLAVTAFPSAVAAASAKATSSEIATAASAKPKDMDGPTLPELVQMPKGVPVGTLAIGKPGAANAALFAAEILATTDPALREKLRAWRKQRSEEVLAQELAQ